MKAIVWTSAPDEHDGYYVELVSKPHNIIEIAVWRPTVKECYEFAQSNGATEVVEN